MDFLFQSLAVGAILTLCAIGFSLTYSVLRITNFALQAALSVSAYLCYLFHVVLARSTGSSVLLAVLIGGLLGVAQYYLVFRRLLNAPPEATVIASLGISLVLESGIALIAGTESRSLDIVDELLSVGSYSFYLRDLMLLCLAIILIPLLAAFLARRQYGLIARAIPVNLRQLLIWGKPIDPPLAVVFFLSYALSSVVGVAIGVGYEVTPFMGFKWGIWAFGVAVVGGLGSIYGAAAGAMVLAVPVMAAYRLGGAVYADATLFLAMTVILLVRPAGIMPLAMRRF